MAHEHGAEVVSLGPVATRQGDLDKLSRQLPSKSLPLVVVDEAGPGGDWLQRDLRNTGDVCWVVAPSVIPNKAGARVTTDRRDARPLARLRRAGDLTPVAVPAVDAEAIRALSRAREETLRDLKAAQWRLHAFVPRHAIRYTGRANGSPAHRRWLREVVCPPPAPPMVLQESGQTVTEQPARLGRLELARHEPVQPWRVAPVVAALQALRGVPVTGAVTTVAERGDRTRGDHPRHLRHELGRTPAEESRGGRRPQGGMTTPGPTQARRALGEGAWA